MAFDFNSLLLFFIPLFVAIDVLGVVPIFLSLLLNLFLVWLVFRYSDLVMKLIGEGGAKAVAKVAALFMAAIAVMMIRVGLTGMIKGI